MGTSRDISTKAYIKGHFAYLRDELKREFGSYLDNTASFSRLLLLFVFVEWCEEYLKKPTLGKSTSRSKPRKRRIKDTLFMQRYMSQVNPTYGKFPGILKAVFRNPLAHRGQPDAFVLKSGTCVGWEFSNGDNDRTKHLKVVRDCAERPVIHLNMGQFYADLQQAIHLFAQTALASSRKSQYLRRIKEMENARTESGLLQQYRYVHEAEFDYIREQIRLLRL